METWEIRQAALGDRLVSVSSPSPQRRRVLNRRARLLAWVTIAYNALEGLVALGAGLAAGSVALVSFGLDSAVEVGSAAALAWQFGHRTAPESRELITLRLIGVSFFALAAYVTFDALRTLLGAAEPEPSPVGIVLTAASVVVMPVLVFAKRRVGRELGSATVLADSTQTLLCTYLSVIVLAGLVVNATLGWSWADPLAALVVAGIAVREGVAAWRGDACCAPGLPAEGGCRCGPGCADGCRA